MKTPEEITALVTSFLKHHSKRVLLITSDNESSTLNMLKQQFERDATSYIIANLANNADIDSLFTNISDVLLIAGISANHRLENYYTKYRLDRWKNKIIFSCPQRLLHSRLDPSIYFVPMKFNHPQKHLFTQLKLNPTAKTSAPSTTFFAAASKDTKIAEPLRLRGHFLNQKRMTKDQFMMQMFADRVLTDNNFKDLMFKLIFASCDDGEMQIAAANAITILNYARIPLAGMDLSRIRISGADLSNANLDGTNFEGADLSNVIFDSTWLVNTNLSKCILKDIVFNQPLPIEMHEEIRTCCYSPDGKLLAYSFYNVIAIHEAESHNISYLLIGHRKQISQTKFSHNSQYLASGSQENDLYLWQIATAKYRKFSGHTSCVWSVGFNPDDSLIVTGSNDQTIRLWSTSSGECLKVIKGHTNSVDYVSFINHGREIISASVDDTIRIWSVETGECVKQIETSSPISTADFTEDGQYVACSGSSSSEFSVNLGEGIELFHLPSQKKTNLRLPDSLSSYSSLRLMVVTAVAFSPDTKMIAAASKAGKLYIWDVITEKLIFRLKGHKTFVMSLCFSPDNSRLISVDKEGSLKSWILTSKKKLQSEPKAINAMVFIPDKNLLAIAEENLDGNIVNLLHIDKGTHVGTLRDKRIVNKEDMSHERSAWDDSWGTFALAYHPQEQMLLASSTDGYLRFWNFNNPHSPGSMEQMARLITYSADAKFVAWTIGDLIVCISAIDKRYHSKTLRDFDNAINAITFSTDGKFFIAITDNLAFNVWSTEDWQIKHQCILPLFRDGTPIDQWSIRSILFNKSNAWFALANSNGDIYIYSTTNWSCLSTLQGHNDAVRQLALSPDDKWLVSVGDDGIICLWSTENWQCIVKKIGDGKLCSVIWSHHHDTFITGSKEGVVQSWRILLSNNQPRLQLMWSNINNEKLIIENVLFKGAQELDYLSQKYFQGDNSDSEADSDTPADQTPEDEDLKRALEMSLEQITPTTLNPTTFVPTPVSPQRNKY